MDSVSHALLQLENPRLMADPARFWSVIDRLSERLEHVDSAVSAVAFLVPESDEPALRQAVMACLVAFRDVVQKITSRLNGSLDQERPELAARIGEVKEGEQALSIYEAHKSVMAIARRRMRSG
jgi:hypothetical protein